MFVFVKKVIFDDRWLPLVDVHGTLDSQLADMPTPIGSHLTKPIEHHASSLCGYTNFPPCHVGLGQTLKR